MDASMTLLEFLTEVVHEMRKEETNYVETTVSNETGTRITFGLHLVEVQRGETVQ